jgi:hypothetical protein
MSNTVSIQHIEDIAARPLAPVVPIKPVIHKSVKVKRRNLKEKPANGLPMFYDKPIYKPKKYDLW